MNFKGYSKFEQSFRALIPHSLLSISRYYLTKQPILRLSNGLHETLILCEERHCDWLKQRSKGSFVRGQGHV